jgi:hypothetical protein
MKDLHVAFIKQMENLWNKMSSYMWNHWQHFLQKIEPTFIKFLHYLENALWKASREILGKIPVCDLNCKIMFFCHGNIKQKSPKLLFYTVTLKLYFWDMKIHNWPHICMRNQPELLQFWEVALLCLSSCPANRRISGITVSLYSLQMFTF